VDASRCLRPGELRAAPFTLAQALLAGVSPDQLRGRSRRRIVQGWYRWEGCPGAGRANLVSIAASLPGGGALSGVTAARLHGLDLAEPDRPEVVVPAGSTVSGRAEAVVRKIQLAPGDVLRRDGLPVTSPLRTCFDLAGRLPLVEAVVAIDMALHAGLVDLDDFRRYVGERDGVAGVVGARRVIDLAEPKAESPMETRLRLLLLRAGLPRPQAQVGLHDARGSFVGRPDLYHPEARLGLEYDGENHRDRLISDNRRQNRLQAIGVLLLRYTGADVREQPTQIVTEVRRALAQARFPGNPAQKRRR
jgi:very-short-patch-repair endonuclease